MEQTKVWKFGNDVDTDQIIASQYLLLPSIDEMKGHVFESVDADFASNVCAGDVIVAGENFGCGSSREQAPSSLRALGIKAVVAKSFARIFFRNAINIGLPVIVCKPLWDDVSQGEAVQLDLENGSIFAQGNRYDCTKLPAHMQTILESGGLIEYLNQEDAGEWA